MTTVQGVYVALVTPFTAKGTIDFECLDAHLEHLAKCGVDGVVPAATTGEEPTLSSEERRRLIQHTLISASKLSLKTIAGCGSNDTATALRKLEEAAELGVDTALVVTPYYNKPGPRGVEAHYLHLAEHSPIPFVLYNVPGRTQVSIGVELSVRLLAHPRILGIKDASGSYAHWLAFAQAKPEHIAWLAGDDDAFAPILALGGQGIISASANVAPRAFVALYQAARAGHWEEAFRLQKTLGPLTRALFLETNPSPAKCALEILGLGRNDLRLPLVPVSEDTRREIQAALTSLELMP